MNIFKILTQDEWKQFQAEKVFTGNPLDKKDGFIHCSTAEQWPRVHQKFFGGESNLILLTVSTEGMGDSLKWEESPRSGEVYPHIYDKLILSSILEIQSL